MALQNVSNQLEIAGSPDSTFDQKLDALNAASKEFLANIAGGASRAQTTEDFNGIIGQYHQLLTAWKPEVDPVVEKEKAAQAQEKTLQQRMDANADARRAATNKQPSDAPVGYPTPTGQVPLNPPQPTSGEVNASLQASPTTIVAGQSSTLNWKVDNAASVSIDQLGSVSPTGSKVVTPTSTTNYRLVAKSNDASRLDKVVTCTVTVNPV